ncbi:LysE family translocator [Halalkalicoccus jeotgali]|uniref:Threonine/homoserine/homoserine lactone efflux protein n=1 Tax=Halalkalicoccus jeotgali (strain DSM 18796 / CECT 7217 / JCM 14584 / KCTC 4019 / B3) TaxID=795797 RepID=D8JBJ1_HALJB|nr:LysE family translocator [Halalkalicoccus jeotgali]ADJ16644.1 threonine/homoserine/homoserine lactone efflux protein [Halalkalicoccus jeotgali B3]ELY39092.1 threonine/homoserine/homoserine lactone efflux protein [Halalkalicoccus jeotgali B3]
MIEFTTLAAFVPAVLAIIVAPGPDTVYTVTQSLKSGRSAGLIAGLGTATGVLVHTIGARLGLAALLRTSALAYMVVKYVGAAYLLYLGVQMFRSDDQFDLQTDLAEQDTSLVESYRKAVVINVSNPKVAVFILAFFPQFVPATANASLQMSLLGLLYTGLSVCYLGVVALFASRVRHQLLHSEVTRRAVQYLSGSVFIGFGLKLAVEKRPTA